MNMLLPMSRWAVMRPATATSRPSSVIGARLGALFRGRKLVLERINALRAQGGQLGLALLDQ